VRRAIILAIGCAHARLIDPAAIAHDVLVAHVPRLNVYPAHHVEEIRDPVLAAHYPRLRFFRGEHDTAFYEWWQTTSLVVVRDDGQERHDIFGGEIDEVFELLEDVNVTDPAALTGSLGALVGPIAEEGRYERHDPFLGTAPFGLLGEKSWQVELGGQGDPHLVLLMDGDYLRLVSIEPGEAEHIADAALDRQLDGPFPTVDEACQAHGDRCDIPIFEQLPAPNFRKIEVARQSSSASCDLILQDRWLNWWALESIDTGCDWNGTRYGVQSMNDRTAIEIGKDELVCEEKDQRPVCGLIPWKR
jgi:hypothetical protein